MSTLLLGSRAGRSKLGLRSVAFKVEHSSYYRSTIRQKSGLSRVEPFYFSVLENESNNSNCPTVVFLHGLLGNNKNLRTFASEFCRHQQARGILVDLPGHGASKHCLEATMSVHNCLSGLKETLQAYGIDESVDSWSLVGHSMGGRIALQYASQYDLLPQPKRLILLDTVPGGLNSSVLHVMAVAEKLLPVLLEQTNMTRKELVEALTTEHGIDVATAQWLGGSYDTKTRQFSFSVEGANNLVKSFFEQGNIDKAGRPSFMETIERVLKLNSRVERIDIVRGGRNSSWKSVKDQVSQLELLEKFPPSKSQLRVHLLADAGHWVHIDDLPGLIRVLGS